MARARASMTIEIKCTGAAAGHRICGLASILGGYWPDTMWPSSQGGALSQPMVQPALTSVWVDPAACSLCRDKQFTAYSVSSSLHWNRETEQIHQRLRWAQGTSKSGWAGLGAVVVVVAVVRGAQRREAKVALVVLFSVVLVAVVRM